jgi:hypothetical protein
MNYVPAPGVRNVLIQFNDTLHRLALREMGDASRWVELIILNDLRPPYLAATASDGVLAYGGQIKIPAPGGGVSINASADDVLGTDLLLTGRRLSVANGDFAVVSGIKNFSQALVIRVTVEKRELGFHPEFGCWVRSLLGNIGGQRSVRLAAFYVKSALMEDPRVASVTYCAAEISGDAITVNATVNPITGSPANISLVV